MLKFEQSSISSPEEIAREEKGSTSEKLTPENIEKSIKEENPIKVKVKRRSGRIEEGWVVTGIDGENAIVVKNVKGEKFLKKVVPLEELQELNKEVDQGKLEKSIIEADSFDDLIKVIEASRGIQGEQKFFDMAELKDKIDKVRKGELSTDYITRTGGLRQKVEDLMTNNQ